MDNRFANELTVINPTVLTAKEQSLILGSSHPDNLRMAQEPDVPQALLDGAIGFEEVQRIRRRQREIISSAAAEIFGINFLEGYEPVLSVPDLDPVTYHPIEAPSIVGILNGETETINRNPEVLARYQMSPEAQDRFSPEGTVTTSSRERVL